MVFHKHTAQPAEINRSWLLHASQAIAMAQTRVWCESYIFDNSRWSGQKVRGDAHISTSRSWARKARDSCLHGAPIRSRCFGAPGLMTLGNCIGPRLCRRDLLHCAARCRSPRAGCFSELYVSAPFQPAYSSFLCLSLSIYIYPCSILLNQECPTQKLCFGL